MKLTKEQIEALREADTAMLDPSDDFEEPRLLEINAIYDLALRGLEAASSRNDALEEAAVLIEHHAVNLNARGWPKELVKLTRIDPDAVRDTYAAAIRALKQTA